MLMVMMHGDWERRCPYCFSRKLGVIDYGLADERFISRGRYWFLLKCKRCGGVCQDINNLESKSQRLSIAQEKREGRVNEEVSIK